MALVVALLLPSAVASAALTRSQRTCVNTVNRYFQRLAATAGEQVQECVRRSNDGELDRGPSESVAACVASDPGGAIGGALVRLERQVDRRCTGRDEQGLLRDPGVFLTDVPTIVATVALIERELLRILYGPEPAGAVRAGAADAGVARCQESVTRRLTRCLGTTLSAFNRCKRLALRTGREPFPGGAVTSDELSACVLDDPRGRIARACDLSATTARGTATTDAIRDALEGACLARGTPLDAAFPHCDWGETEPSVEGAHTCLAAPVSCLGCVALNRVDALMADCDVLDDGLANGTCGCGDGVVTEAEECDDGNDVDDDDCDTDCRFPEGQRPVADAGPDQMRAVGDVVALDGSGSSDPQDDPLTFDWAFTDRPAGSAAALDDPASEQPSFAPDLPGTYVVELVVDDGRFASRPDAVMIEVAMALDTDGDGLTDAEEEALGTDPDDADSDDDGLSDGAEVRTYGTHPLLLDTDEDGLGDGAEVHDYRSDPNDSDSDDDGFGDTEEVVLGSDPTDGDSIPGPAQVTTSPRDGDHAVSIERVMVARFTLPVDPVQALGDAVFGEFSGVRLPAAVRLAIDRRTATVQYDAELPDGARISFVVDGDALRDQEGRAVDADGDGAPGGIRRISFTTTNLARIPSTDVFGYVFDSYATLPGGGNHPIEGVTLRVVGLPGVTATTDADGRFLLEDVPGREFFVEIDGSTATNAPLGTAYPTLSKPLHSLAGHTTQLNMQGTPFHIFLPPMDLGDLQPLSTTGVTQVGFGAAARAQLRDLFPGIDPAVFAAMQVSFAPGNAIDHDGNPATQGLVIPVAPGRLPAPLPASASPTLVVSIQAPGAAMFDVPAPVTFPNVDGLPPGAQAVFYRFNHESGHWEAYGTGTVRPDGLGIVSDPGVGVPAPGWHYAVPGVPVGSDGDCDPDEPVDIEVEPEPVICTVDAAGTACPGAGTVNDSFFVQDGGQLTLRIENRADAPDPGGSACSSVNLRVTPMTVEISARGPVPDFIDGLLASEHDFRYLELGPGESREIVGMVKTLLTDVTRLSADRLYGARINVRVTAEKPTGTEELLETHFFVYRYLDVSDSDPTNGFLGIPDTHADGPGGIERERRADLLMPDDVAPSLSVETPDHFRVATTSAEAVFTFDPIAPGNDLVAAVTLITPDGTHIATPLHLIGDALMERWCVDRDVFRIALSLIATNDLVADPTERALIDEPAEQEALVDRSVARAQELLAPLAPALVLAPSCTGNEISLDDFSVLGEPSAVADHVLGRASMLDIMRDNLAILVSNARRFNDPQRWFRLSERINEAPTGTAKVFLEHYFKARAFADIDELVFTLGKTLAHEVGHQLGLVHTAGFGTDHVARALALAAASSDVMAQGVDSSGARAFVETVEAGRMAVGQTWDDAEAAFAFAYYAAWVNRSDPDKWGDSEGGPDLESIPGPAIGGPILWIVNPASGRLAIEEDLGDVGVDGMGGHTSTRTLELANLGDQDLVIDGVEGPAPDSGFALASTIPGGTIVSPRGVLAFAVTFDPEVSGPTTAMMRVRSNALAGDWDVHLAGRGQSGPADIRLDVPNNNTGGLRLSEPAVTLPVFATLHNDGLAALSVHEIRVDDASLGQFEIAGLPPGFPQSPLVLAPGESLPLDLVFDARALGLQRGTIEIVSDDPDMPILVQPVVGTGISEDDVPFDWGDDFVAIRPVGSSSWLRTRSSETGAFEVTLAGDTPYEFVIFDPVSGLVWIGAGVTPPAGRIFHDVGRPVLRASTAPDDDGDGLPNDVERAIGTRPDVADTDGDGVDDLTEVLEGLDPLEGLGYPLGVIGGIRLPGVAHDVVLEGTRAYVATGSHGLAIVDVALVEEPIVLGLLELPGVAFEVAYDSALEVAVVGTRDAEGGVEGGTFVVDVSDPTRPAIVRQLAERGAFDVFDGIAYVGQAGAAGLAAVELLTGEQLSNVPGGPVPDTVVARPAGVFVGGSPNNNLVSFGLGPGAPLLDESAVPNGGGSPRNLTARDPLFVGEDLAYVGTFHGLGVFDVSDPTELVPLPSHETQLVDVGAVAANGSGRLLAATVVDANNSAHAALFEHTDLAAPPVFLTSFDTPGEVYQVATASGIGFIADGAAGLSTLSYLETDTLGVPPTVSLALTADVVDLDPNAPGVQVREGRRFPLRVSVQDDVQVREVELLVNGAVVRTDVSFPWDFIPIAIPEDPLAPAVRVQVRATDTGGNAAVSDELVIDLLPDTTPPTVALTFPGAGAQLFPGVKRVSVRFSEPMDPATLDAAGVRLETAAGAPVAPLSRQVRDDGREVVLAFDGLLEDGYTIVVAGGVTDRVGNTLGAEARIDFTLSEAPAAPLFPEPVLTGDLFMWQWATADVDGSGAPDLVTVDASVVGVVVFLDPGFPQPGPRPRDTYLLGLPADIEPLDVALADLNGDTVLDIVTYNAGRLTGGQVQHSMSVLFGTGDGRFAPAVTLALPDAGSYGPLAVGDVDGDTVTDAVVAGRACTAGCTTMILHGKRQGALDPPVPVHWQDQFGRQLALNADRIVLDDMNRDGALDVLALSIDGDHVQIYPNVGAGTFGELGQVSLLLDTGGIPGPRTRIQDIRTADLNGDGLPDLLGATFRGGSTDIELAVQVNQGDMCTGVCTGILDGEFGPFASVFPGGVLSLVVGEFTGDQALDVVGLGVASPTVETVDLLAGNGDGTFAAATEVAVMRVAGAGVVVPTSFNVAAALLAEDWNVDGARDVAAHLTPYPSAVTFLLGDGLGGFDVPGDEPAIAGREIEAGLLDGDAFPDVVVAGRDGRTIRWGRGDGTFDTDTVLDRNILWMDLADVDADNDLDIVEVRRDSLGDAVYATPNTGARTFGAARVTDTGTLRSLALGDVDGDTDLDLVYSQRIGSRNVLAVRPGFGTLGSLSFGNPIEQDISGTGGPLLVGDLNEDDDLDAVLLAIFPGHAVFLGGGDGTFTLDHHLVEGPGDRESALLVDLDQDDHLDLIVRRLESVFPTPDMAWLSVHRGRGDGTFEARVDYPVPGGSFANVTGHGEALDVGDLDLDGHLDVILTSAQNDLAIVLFGLPDGTLGRVEQFRAGIDLRDIALADLDADGDLDFVTPSLDLTLGIISPRLNTTN